MRIPSSLIPYCPVCQKPMRMNLRSDDTFVQDKGWYEAAKKYNSFLVKHRIDEDGKVLFLELGVGANTPGIIKYPFWRMTAQNANATYVCINFGEAVVPEELSTRSICVSEDIGKVLDVLI